jgi:hypothetical protein
VKNKEENYFDEWGSAPFNPRHLASSLWARGYGSKRYNDMF